MPLTVHRFAFVRSVFLAAFFHAEIVAIAYGVSGTIKYGFDPVALIAQTGLSMIFVAALVYVPVVLLLLGTLWRTSQRIAFPAVALGSIAGMAVAVQFPPSENSYVLGALSGLTTGAVVVRLWLWRERSILSAP